MASTAQARFAFWVCSHCVCSHLLLLVWMSWVVLSGTVPHVLQSSGPSFWICFNSEWHHLWLNQTSMGFSSFLICVTCFDPACPIATRSMLKKWVLQMCILHCMLFGNIELRRLWNIFPSCSVIVCRHYAFLLDMLGWIRLNGIDFTLSISEI